MRYLGRALVVALVAVFAAAASPALAADPSLLVHFDTGYDDTSGSLFPYGKIRKSDGSSYPSPTISTSQRKFGRASVEFTGTSQTSLGYGLATTSGISLGTKDFTIDFWLYPKNPSFHAAWFNVFNNEFGFLYPKQVTYDFGRWGGRITNTYPELVITRSNTVILRRLAFRTKNFTFWDIFSISPFFNQKLYGSNKWNHVVITRYREYIGVGVNGDIFWSRVSPSFSIAWPDTLYLGGYGGDRFYDGYLDEMRITVGQSLFRSSNPSSTTDPDTYYSGYTVPDAPAKGAHDLVLNAPARAVAPTDINAPGEEVLGPLEGIGERPATTTTKTFFRPDGTPFYDYDFTGQGPDQKPVATRFYSSDGAVKTGERSYTEGELSRETFFAPDGSTVVESRLFHPQGGTRKEIIRRNGSERYNRYLEDNKLAYSHVYDLDSRDYDGVRTWSYDTNGMPVEEILYYDTDRYEKKLTSYDGSGAVTQIERFARVPRTGDSPDYYYTLSRFTNGKVSFERNVAADSRTWNARTIEDTAFSEDGVIVRRELFDFSNDRMSLTLFGNDGKRNQTHVWVLSTAAYVSRTTYDYDADGKLEKEKTIRFRDGLTIQPYAGYDVTGYAPNGAKKETYTYTFYDGSFRLKSYEATRYDQKTGDVLYRNVGTVADREPLTITNEKSYDKNGILLAEYTNHTEQKPGKAIYYKSDGSVYFEVEYAYENATDYVKRSYAVYGSTRVLKEEKRYRILNPSKTPFPQASDTELATVSEDKLVQTKIGDAVLSSLGITPSSISQSSERDALYRLTKGILERYKTRLSGIGGGASEKYRRYAAYIDAARDFQSGIYAIEYRAWGPAKGWNNDQQLTFEVGGSWIGTDEANGEEFWGAYIIPGGGAKYDAASTAFIDMSNITAVNRVLKETSYDGLTTLPKRKEKWDSFRSGDTIVFNSAENGKLYYWNTLANNGAGGYLSVSERVKADPSVNLLLDRMLADFRTQGVDLKTLDVKTILRKFYLYMYEKSLISYIGDAGDTNQLPSETLERGGGDCDDNGTLTLSLAYNLLLRLEKYDEANRLGFLLGAADSNALSASNFGVGHAAAGYREADGTYYIMDGAPLYMGMAKQRPITEAEALPALSGGSTKTGYVKAAQWNFAADAFSSVNGGTVFFASPRGANPYKMSVLPQTAIENTSAHIGELGRYLEPFNWRIEAAAKRFVEFIPRMSEKSANDLVEITHDYFRDLVSYAADSGDTWNLVATTLGEAIKGGKIVGEAVGDGEDLAFTEASLLTRILYDRFLAQGTYAPLALEKARQRVILVGRKDGTSSVKLFVGFVLPAEDERYTRVRLLDPLADKIGPVQFYADLFDTAQYSFVVTKDGTTAISHTNWGALVLK